MKLPNIGGLVTIGRAFVAANRPEILFGTSVVTTVAAVVAAGRGGYVSGQQVLEAKMDLPVDAPPMTNKDIAKLTWINYLPAAGLTGGALGATTGLHIVHVKEKKQLAAVALLAIEEAKKEGLKYKKEITDSIGLSTSEDPKELQKAAGKSGIAKLVHSDGEIEELYLCRDQKTQRDFWSNRVRIEDALLEVNRRLTHEDTELNSFYSLAQMGTIPEGEDMGWNAGDYIGLEWDTTVRDDGRPVRTFRFTPEPDPTRSR